MMKSNFQRDNYPVSVICVMGLLLIMACSQPQKKLFEQLRANTTGINFRNDIRDSDSSQSFINEFGYMGGGVGIGDFNKDGLKDIVFTANQSSCRIYVNKGGMKFEDVSERAGLLTNVWATGVSIADINDDGLDDIYICTYGKNLLTRSPNLLYINQGDLTFKEMAAEYGLADTAYSSQAAFFDYDRDGDLDMYLANYSFNSTNTSANNIVFIDTSGKSIANDKLYRNDGDVLGNGHPVFTDVSLSAGIKEDGYGLGLTISDINNDGWPDIYVANDFISNDRLWLNQKDGTFRNVIARAMKHQSYSSMGVDAADVNNDGWQDVVTLDMLPEWNERKKVALFFMNYDRYKAERFMGYEPEFMRNMLQINKGLRSHEDEVPFFSEVGQMAGIAATDWSWSVLLADYNLDGWKDMYLTNGVGRDFIHADFLEFSSQISLSNLTKAEQQDAIRKKLASLKHVPLPNYCYFNNGFAGFEDVSNTVGIDLPSLSNGAAYADLDNDGDLDLIVNNINEEAFLWQNNLRPANQSDTRHYLKIILKGLPGNRRGFGTKITIHQGNKLQYLEQQPVRGYYSSVDQDLLAGLGSNAEIDSLVVTWPNGKEQAIVNPRADTTLVLHQQHAETSHSTATPAIDPLLLPFPDKILQGVVHQEYEFNDFAAQRMLPQKYSHLGPGMASGDVNGDGLTDLFISGAANQNGTLLLQHHKNGFDTISIQSQGRADQTTCIFMDVNNDGSLDLLIGYGDLQAPPGDEVHRPRLFLNNGKGKFTEKMNTIPAEVACITGTISAADFDNDGDMDVFIGGRVTDSYPTSPRSFLLRNDGGVFSDVTETVCPALKYAGMLTASVWSDMDADLLPDLVIAGEWMPIRFFKNQQGKLEEVTSAQTGLTNLQGMWRSLTLADMDGDGDMDLIAGNIGQNNLYRADENHPMSLYARDLDANGNIDPLLFYFIPDKSGKRQSFPAISRAQFSEQTPGIKKKFLLSADFARAGAKEILAAFGQEGAPELICNEIRSCILENLGSWLFMKRELPAEVQIAPVNAALCEDFDGDAVPDLLLAGNEYYAEVIGGRYDASYGLLLKGLRTMNFAPLSAQQSGLFMDGDIKSLKWVILSNGERVIIAATNNASLQSYRLNRKTKTGK